MIACKIYSLNRKESLSKTVKNLSIVHPARAIRYFVIALREEVAPSLLGRGCHQ